MKKLLTVLLCITMVLCVTGCKRIGDPKDPIIKDAVKLLQEHWADDYSEIDFGDGYFEIKSTRVITIKENDVEMFKDVKYVIEFVLYTDYYGSAPYYMNSTGINDNVIVYNDGSMEVVSRYINTYRAHTYNSDFSDFIESIEDYNDAYNCKKDLK